MHYIRLYVVRYLSVFNTSRHEVDAISSCRLCNILQLTSDWLYLYSDHYHDQHTGCTNYVTTSKYEIKAAPRNLRIRQEDRAI